MDLELTSQNINKAKMVFAFYNLSFDERGYTEIEKVLTKLISGNPSADKTEQARRIQWAQMIYSLNK